MVVRPRTGPRGAQGVARIRAVAAPVAVAGGVGWGGVRSGGMVGGSVARWNAGRAEAGGSGLHFRNALIDDKPPRKTKLTRGAALRYTLDADRANPTQARGLVGLLFGHLPSWRGLPQGLRRRRLAGQRRPRRGAARGRALRGGQHRTACRGSTRQGESWPEEKECEQLRLMSPCAITPPRPGACVRILFSASASLSSHLVHCQPYALNAPSRSPVSPRARAPTTHGPDRGALARARFASCAIVSSAGFGPSSSASRSS